MKSLFFLVSFKRSELLFVHRAEQVLLAIPYRSPFLRLADKQNLLAPSEWGTLQLLRAAERNEGFLRYAAEKTPVMGPMRVWIHKE